MEERRVEGLTVEETLYKYENMIYKFLHSEKTKTNAVYNIEDLMQEGRIGIIRAFETYDESRNVKFSTYVYRYIQGAILDYQKANMSALSGGHYLYGILRKLGEDVTEEDLLKLGYSKETARAVNYFGENFTSTDVTLIQEWYPADTDREYEIIELSTLKWKEFVTPRQAEVIGLHLGFEGEPLNWSQIGRMLKINPAAAKESYLAGMKKLSKNKKFINDAKSYVE